MVAIEEDGDEIFTPMDVCRLWRCQTWEPGAQKPTHPALVRKGKFMCCPKCGGSYGEAPAEVAQAR